MQMFAAIDVGSFELELGIFEISSKNGIRSIDHVKHMIPLGRDTYNTGKISYSLVEEMCLVLEDFLRIMKGYQVTAYRAYATSAMREASNRQMVLEQIRVRTGIDVGVISNSEQRFISYKAIAGKDAEFHKVIQKGTAIVDVGFGSMQTSFFDKDTLIFTQNLPLGVLRLRGLVERAKTTAKVEHTLVTELVDNTLGAFRKMYLKDREVKNLIAIGEPILTVFNNIPAERRGDKVTKEVFFRMYEYLKSMTCNQIEETFNVNAAYAAMLFPTVAIYRQMMEITGAEVIWLPGIRMVDGIAAEYAEEKKLLKFNHNFSDDIILTSRNMAKRYKSHMPHIQAVEASALQLFDGLKKYHGLKGRERLLLQIAVNLHSCGKFVTMRGAAQCAYNIVMATEIIGLSHTEREVVANIVKFNAENFQYQEEKTTLVVAKLTAILRLADAMDRSHKNKLENCRLQIKDKKLQIITEYPGDITLEAMSVEEKGEFFEEIFGIRPVLKQKKRV